MKKKEDIPDLRARLVSDVMKKVTALLEEKGRNTDTAAIENVANEAIDRFVEEWYEVSLEALQLKDGEADFITDEEIDDPELIAEAKSRVLKELYEEPPEDFYDKIAQNVMSAG